jgi:hypothetical protein
MENTANNMVLVNDEGLLDDAALEQVAAAGFLGWLAKAAIFAAGEAIVEWVSKKN